MLLWPFNKYPGTDYETFNWEWILKTVKEWVATMQTFKDTITAAWDDFRDWTTGEIDQMHDDFAQYVDVTEGALNTGAIANGAITKIKINNDFLKEIINAYKTPNDFGVTGDDSDLLEYAINNTPEGGILFIDRTYTLTRNITINKNSATKRITIFGSNTNSGINVGDYEITGSIPGNTGNIQWVNINFTGKHNVFDGYYLIRMYFNNCVFVDMDSIFYNSNSANRSYMQSIQFKDCEMRHIHEYILESGQQGARTSLSDIVFDGCLIEWCDSGILDPQGYYGVRVKNCCIEGFETDDPLFANGREGSDLTIMDNYFESNHTTYVDFSLMNSPNPFTFVFENNNIYEHVNKEFGIIVTGARNQINGDSIFNVSNNTFNSEGTYGDHIYMIDASNAVEDLRNWCVWNNNNFNGYMNPKKDPNNRLTIFKNVNTFNLRQQYTENADGIVYDNVHSDLTIGGPLVTTYGKVVNFYAFITVTADIPYENPTYICRWKDGWKPDIPSGRYNLVPLIKSNAYNSTLWVTADGIRTSGALATGTYFFSFTYLKK